MNLSLISKVNRLRKLRADKLAGQGHAIAPPSFPSSFAEFAPLTKIRSSGEVIPFHPYPFQLDVIDSIERSPNTIILKSRQLGLSELICCWLLKRAVSEPGFNAAVFSKTQRDSSDLATRINHMAVSLGDRCPDFDSQSKMQLSFKNLGSITFLPVTSRAARGIPSVSVLVFDEAAFIDGIDGLYAAAAPTMAMLGDRGRVIFNSTPNGRSGLFYKIWTEENTWNKVRLHYSQHPVYAADPDWAAKQKASRNLTESQWNQEFELDFSESEVNVFSHEDIEAAAIGHWQGAIAGHRYLVGIDTATSGADYWVVTIWDVTSKPYSLVAMYRERRKSSDYNLAQTANLIRQYRVESIYVESNAAGQIALESLIRMMPTDRIEGVVTTANSKRINTDRLVLLLERREVVFPPDCPLKEEMLNFRQSETGKREAASGFHDDVIMSMAIAFSNLDFPGGEFKQGRARY